MHNINIIEYVLLVPIVSLLPDLLPTAADVSQFISVPCAGS